MTQTLNGASLKSNSINLLFFEIKKHLKQEIINVLDQACAQLGIYAPVCKSWVDENVQTLIDQLINQIVR